MMDAKQRRDLAERNPKVDLKEVGEGLKLVQQLEDMGVAPTTYNLTRPYGPSRTHAAAEACQG